MEVTTPSGKVEELAPRMNYYERSTDPVGTPAVRESPKEDLYVSLMAFSAGRRHGQLQRVGFPAGGVDLVEHPHPGAGLAHRAVARAQARGGGASADGRGAAPPVAGSDMNRGAA